MTSFRVGCVAALVLGTAVVLSSCARSPTDTAVVAANIGRIVIG